MLLVHGLRQDSAIYSRKSLYGCYYLSALQMLPTSEVLGLQ